ncbi:MAG: tetratricopeptide repeat protein [Dysgonamonadaceae bacterium]|jgi:signal transduction histidine kinase|nr:tetratricopeptide repeat protein [Dysgonamonadaceae bacterium]
MNTRKIFWTVVIVVLLLPYVSFAQYIDHRNHKVDSLEYLLKTNPPTGDDLAVAYNKLMWGYSQTDIEKTRYYAGKAIDLAEKMVYKMLMSDAYRLIGDTYYKVSQYDSAMVYYEKALWAVEQAKAGKKQYRKHVFDDALSTIYGSIGNLYNIQGKRHEAIDYYTKALKLFEKWDWKESQAIAYENIGEMYLSMDNYEQAEINFTKLNAIGQEINDSLIIMYVDKELSALYLIQKNYGKALEHAEAARRYIFTHPEEGEDSKAIIFNLFAQIYSEGYNDIGKAENYIRQALQIDSTLIVPREKSTSLALLSSIYLQRSEWRKAEQTALKALSIDSTEPSNTMALYKNLAKAYAHLGNAAKADEYIDKLQELQASWSNKHYQSAIREMEVKYETEKKETKIAALEGEKRLIMWLSIAGGAVLLLALAAFFFLWRWTVQKKRLAESQIKQLEQEKQLIATQAVLDGEIQERTRLARDLHDSLGSILAAAKYNLVVIKQISMLGEKDVEHYNKAVCLLDDSMDEMRRVAHHLMPEPLSRTGLKQSVADFCSAIPVVKFSYYGDETRFDPKLEVMIYRILHELVTNALKHAGAKHILVQLVRDEDGIALTVQDDGCGFDLSAESKGMGLRNICSRVESFNGNLDIDSQPGKGTEIHIEFKL